MFDVRNTTDDKQIIESERGLMHVSADHASKA